VRTIRLLIAVGALGMVCGPLSGCQQPGFDGTAQATSMPQLQPQRPLLDLGVYERGDQTSYAGVTRFIAATGVQPNIVLQFTNWGAGFDFSMAYQARAHHAELLIQLQPFGIRLSAIAAGRYDEYLRTFANEARRFGGPVIIGFAHEMNGTWYSWSHAHAHAHAPATASVAAWRHVVTVFRRQAAGNVTWLWTISHTSNVARLREYWPGQRYVDWVGIDGYLKVPSATYSNTFGNTVRAVRAITAKPILIAQTAVGPDTHHQALDISQLFAGVKRQHLLGLVWFDRYRHGGINEQNWRLEGRKAALTAFNLGVRDCLW
jgi:mannan endo-1,4-beta-mannosidase